MLAPTDDNYKSLNLTPNTNSFGSYELNITSTPTNITLHQKTWLFEIQADSADIYLKYWENASYFDNWYDEKIKAWYVRHYVLPKNVTKISLVSKTNWTVTLIQK